MAEDRIELNSNPSLPTKKTSKISAFYHEYERRVSQQMDPNKELLIGSIDYVLLALAVIILAFGLIMVYSASSAYAATYHHTSTYYLKKQIFYIFAGIGVTIGFVLFMTPRVWKVATPVMYFGTVGLLGLVLVIGKNLGGAKRWISIGGFTLQPSELAKTVAVMMIALFMTTYSEKLQKGQSLKNRFSTAWLVPVFY